MYMPIISSGNNDFLEKLRCLYNFMPTKQQQKKKKSYIYEQVIRGERTKALVGMVLSPRLFSYCSSIPQGKVSTFRGEPHGVRVNTSGPYAGKTDIGLTAKVSDVHFVDIVGLSKLTCEQRCSLMTFRGDSKLPIDEDGYVRKLSLSGRLIDGNYCTARRLQTLFKASRYIGIDIDIGLSLNDAIDKMKMLGWRSFINTTKSHIPVTKERFRIVIELDREVTCAKEYMEIMSYVVDEVFPMADPLCVDAARFFFACRQNVYLESNGTQLPVDVILAERRAQHEVATTATTGDSVQTIDFEDQSAISSDDLLADSDRFVRYSSFEDVLRNGPPGISGSHGSRTTFRVILKAGYMMGPALTAETLMDYVQRLYNPRCIPSWMPDELAYKVEKAVAWIIQNPTGSRRSSANIPASFLTRKPRVKTETQAILERLGKIRSAKRKGTKAPQSWNKIDSIKLKIEQAESSHRRIPLLKRPDKPVRHSEERKEKMRLAAMKRHGAHTGLKILGVIGKSMAMALNPTNTMAKHFEDVVQIPINEKEKIKDETRKGICHSGRSSDTRRVSEVIVLQGKSDLVCRETVLGSSQLRSVFLLNRRVGNMLLCQTRTDRSSEASIETTNHDERSTPREYCFDETVCSISAKNVKRREGTKRNDSRTRCHQDRKEAEI